MTPDSEKIIAAAQAAMEPWAYGREFIRITPGHEPESRAHMSGAQERVVTWATGTSASGIDLCAQWIERVFAAAGIWYVTVNAQQIYDWYCPLTDLAQLKVGMVVAVPSHPHSMSGRALGHVGLYVGDATIMDCLGGRVRTAPLEAWLAVYGVMSEPRWGWLFSVDLSVCE